MNIKFLLILIGLSFTTMSNAQIFEIQKNSKTETNIKSSTVEEKEDIIIDNAIEEVIVPLAVISVDKWMSIVQAKNRDYSLIESSLKNGQNVNQGIFDGSSVLHLSAWQNDEKLFKLGIQYGGIISNTNKNGETALHWASYSKNPNIINMALLDKNSLKIINKQNKNGRTALHFNALQWGNLEVAKALVLQKADINIPDNNGQTPLHYALSGRKWNLAKLYIDSGADITLKDKNGEGINEYIKSKGDIEGFKILFNYFNIDTQNFIKNKPGLNLSL